MANSWEEYIFSSTGLLYKGLHTTVVRTIMIVSELMDLADEYGYTPETVPLSPKDMYTLVQACVRGLEDKQCTRVLEYALKNNATLEQTVNHIWPSRDATKAQVRSVVEEHPHAVAEYKGGKLGVMNFFIGQVMKADPRMNPEYAKVLIQEVVNDQV